MKKRKILIVDDDKVVRTLLSDLLTSRGYEVVEAYNGVEAMEYVKTEEPDLIISDVMMPIMDGFMLLRALKKNKIGKNIPFVFYTAQYVTKRDAELATKLGASRFIMKEGRLKDLLHEIEAVLKEYEAGHIKPVEPVIKTEVEYLKHHNERVTLKLAEKVSKLEKEISGRKKAEEGLQFRSILLDSIKDSIFVLDQEGKIIYVNEASYKDRGFTKEEFIGKSIEDIDAPQHKEFVKQRMAQLFKTGSIRLETVHRKKDGASMDVEVHAQVIEAGGGKVIVSICRDITERKRAEEVLRESEERFRSAFEKAAVGMDIIALDGRIIKVNRTFCEMLGYSEQELLQKSIQDITHPDDVQANLNYHKRLVNGENSEFHMEKRYVHKDGRIVWALLSASMVHDAKGNPAYMIGQMQDISQRKWAEDALKASEELYRVLVENINLGITLVDANYKIIMTNRAVCTMLKKSASQFIGKECFKEFEKRDKVCAHCPGIPAMATGQPAEVETEGVRDDGSRFSVHIHAVPLFGPDGKAKGFIEVVEDITERKKGEKVLRNSERLYRLMFENNPQPMWVYDLEILKFLAVNDAAIFHYGYSRDEFLSMTLKDIRPAEDIAALSTIMPKLSTGLNYSGIWRHRKKDGTILDVEIISHALDFAGKKAMFVLVNDITERKRVEEALRQSEEQYRMLFHHSPVGVFHYDMQLRIIDCNESFIEISKSSHEKLIGLDLNMLKDQHVIPMLRKALTGEEGFYEGFYRVTTSPAEIWISMRTAPIFNDRDEIQGGVAIVQDITERKKAEKELEQSLSLFKASLESTADGILVVDREGKAAAFNKRFAEMWRIPEAIVETRDDNQMLSFVLNQLQYPEDFLAKVKALYAQPEAESFDTIDFKDGRIFERYSRPQWIGNAVAGRVWSFRDVTTRKKVEEELLKSHMELSILYKISSAISKTIDMNELFPIIVNAIEGIEIIGVELKGWMIFTVEGENMKLIQNPGHSEDFLNLHRDMKIGDCLCGLAAKAGEIVTSRSNLKDERHTIKYRDEGPHGHIIIPLKLKDVVMGVLCIYLPANIDIDEDKRKLFISLGNQIAIAMNNAKLYEETRALSLQDPLTCLANRRHLDIVLERQFAVAKRYKLSFSVIMLDIDNFKEYNDEHGHIEGDKILTQIADILVHEVRETDLVVRYGGEEFLILLPETKLIRPHEVAERIRKIIEAETGLTVSLGIASHTQEFLKKEDIISKADKALYEAKKSGKNRTVEF